MFLLLIALQTSRLKLWLFAFQVRNFVIRLHCMCNSKSTSSSLCNVVLHYFLVTECHWLVLYFQMNTSTLSLDISAEEEVLTEQLRHIYNYKDCSYHTRFKIIWTSMSKGCIQFKALAKNLTGFATLVGKNLKVDLVWSFMSKINIKRNLYISVRFVTKAITKEYSLGTICHPIPPLGWTNANHAGRSLSPMALWRGI